MNICKITTAAVAILMACTLLTSSPAFAQDVAKKTSVFDDPERGEIAFGPPVLNLSAAVNPLGDLQLSLLSLSHDEFEELRNLIAKDASSWSTSKANTSGVRNYQLTRNQVKYLDEHVRPLVKAQLARPFHTYRIARSEPDFLFGELPVAGEPVQASKFVASLKFETDRTRNGNRLLAGQFCLQSAPDEPIDVEFTLKPQDEAESPISQVIAIPAGDRVWLRSGRNMKTKL